MPKPACPKCQLFFRPKQNGHEVIEAAPTHPDTKPGTSEAFAWAPYKIWQADLWECRGCGAEIIVGYGREPISIHHEASFNLELDRLQNPSTINDC